MKIVIPELNNPNVTSATKNFSDIDFLPADSLEQAAEIVASGAADSIISGIDYPSRDVILACKSHISLASNFFSSCFICKRDSKYITLADGGVNKLPNEDQLYTIVEDTAKTHEAYFSTQPKIAMLSYSTYGSGGKNPDLTKIHSVIDKIRQNHPNWIIDGEMQLDAAVSPDVAEKKTPGSPLKGTANILIAPDLNSGNILYKSLERFSGFTCAGPIIQGFSVPLADLSRGSSTDDIALTIEVIKKLFERKIQ